MLELLAGVGGTALLLLASALLLKWKQRTPKVTALLMFAAGSGLAILFGSIVAGFGLIAGGITGLGGTILTIATLVLLFIFVHDLWPKHKANGMTAWAGLFLPTFAAFGGGAVSTLVSSASGSLLDAGSAVMGQLF